MTNWLLFSLASNFQKASLPLAFCRISQQVLLGEEGIFDDDIQIKLFMKLDKNSLEENVMKKKILRLIVVILMLALVPATAFAHTAEDPFVTDLVSGGGNVATATDIGDVSVWNDGFNLYVEYVVTDEAWCLTKTHFEIATSPEDIPQKKGNPIPGQFSYASEHDCVAGVTYTIPISWDPETELLIASHGVAQTGGTNGLGATLPDQVTINITFPGLGFGDPSYFDVTVSGGTILDGMYDSYCVDTDNGYIIDTTADVYSSYEPLLPGLIEKPENLDLVNWIINQAFVGQVSGCGGNYTWGDVQWAIWQLLEDDPPASHSSLGDWSLCRAQEILNASLTNGEGFVPGCGEFMGVILVPINLNNWQPQLVIIWVEVPCVESETAWGGDYFWTPLEFPGKNWAIYFAYTVQ